MLLFRGNKATLVKRLKSHYQRQRLQALNRAPKKNASDRHYDFLLVLDFECTCEDNVYEYNHEIIEFPVVLVSTKQMRIVSPWLLYRREHGDQSSAKSTVTNTKRAY